VVEEITNKKGLLRNEASLFYIYDIFDLAYAIQFLDDREDEES